MKICFRVPIGYQSFPSQGQYCLLLLPFVLRAGPGQNVGCPSFVLQVLPDCCWLSVELLWVFWSRLYLGRVVSLVTLRTSDVHESVQYSARDIYCLSCWNFTRYRKDYMQKLATLEARYLETSTKSQLLSLQKEKKKYTLNKIKEEEKWVDVVQKRLTWCLGFTGKRDLRLHEKLNSQGNSVKRTIPTTFFS